MHGWLILDKPEGLSSAQALNHIKRYVKPYKIGHAGTLDLFASGVLLVAIGKATKLIEYAMLKNKAYSFTIKWGDDTDTQDNTGNIIQSSDKRATLEELQKVIGALGSGWVWQRPPDYSALHINGTRAYQLARAGEKVELIERKVFLESVEIISHNEQQSEFILKCGKGFYVRALARDIAMQLKGCGHVSALRRLAIEKFSLCDAIKLDCLKKVLHNAERSDCLLPFLKPLHAVLDDILVVYVSEEEEKKLLNGHAVESKVLIDEGKSVAVYSQETKILLAICNVSDWMLIPHKVFC